MVKRFLLGALFMLPFFNLQAFINQNSEIAPDLYLCFSTDFMPFAQQWFKEIKIKHAEAGFDESTFLREGYRITFSGQIVAAGWMASYYNDLIDDVKKEFNNLSDVKVICGQKNDLEKLNRVCQLYYENPEEFSEKDQEYLDRIEGIFLHEIYHCLHLPKVHNSYFDTIYVANNIGLGCAGIAYAIAHYGTQKASHKEYALSAMKYLGAAWIANVMTAIGQDIYNVNQNEYEADMHAIKHGNAQTHQGFISFFKEVDESYDKAGYKIFDSIIKKLEASKADQWNVLKPSNAALVYILKGMQNIYIDRSHPSIESRIQNFSEAIEKTKQ